MSKAQLRLDWASYKAAKYAVMNWHYSRTMPAGKLVKVGVWENGEFIGVVLFGRGANNNLAQSLSVTSQECAELVRVALREHQAPVTRIVAIAIRFLREACPGLKVLASYADPAQGHHGGIYQGGNWLYQGRSRAQRELLFNGEFMHKRTATSRFGTASPKKISALTGAQVEYGPKAWKHIYALPLSQALRPVIESRAKPYPKREKHAMDAPSVTAAVKRRPSRSKHKG